LTVEIGEYSTFPANSFQELLDQVIVLSSGDRLEMKASIADAYDVYVSFLDKNRGIIA